MNAAVIDSPKPRYRPPLKERLRVAWQNWKVRKTGRAVRYLSKQLQNDPGFRQSWHANIAMPIYDNTRDYSPTHFKQHDGEVVLGVRNMPVEQANYIADRVLNHLFNA